MIAKKHGVHSTIFNS